MSHDSPTNDPSQGHPSPNFCMEYTEDALLNLFSSHFSGLAGLVLLDRISDGETIIVRRRDGTTVTLADRATADKFLRESLGWLRTKPVNSHPSLTPGSD